MGYKFFKITSLPFKKWIFLKSICDFLISNDIESRLILLDGKDPNEIGHIKTWQTISCGVRMDESVLYRYKLINKL